MFTDKKVLLIAGGGTLGTYVAEELLRLGASVEIVCPEEKQSDHPRLRFHQSWATEAFLRDLFAKNRYDGIVNFVHYQHAEEYEQIHPLLIQNTDHLIFLSSYRVYANEQHPITEEAPRLFDVITDREIRDTELYAFPKARCEDYLRQKHSGEPWTIVRPVISFSQRRFDLLMYSGTRVLEAAKNGEELLLPTLVKDFTAGLDWAGNSGKLIAHLLFNPAAIGETYSIYSGHGLTWGEVAELYRKIVGLRVRWCSEEEYLDFCPELQTEKWLNWAWHCDRRYNRDIDPTKVLRATGLTAADFTSVEEGIRHELALLGRESK
ncbi:MAG: hypothetical protein IJO76_03925 [Clostridia bacterium]|nr:hypothetical protein [Clostridia bacterium]